MFVQHLQSMIGRLRPDYMALAVDGPRAALVRRELLPAYKANRKTPTEADAYQLKLCERVADVCGVPTLRHSGWEADDILATLAHVCAGPNCEVIIASLDKDLGQCVTERRVTLWDGRKLNDEDDIRRRWEVAPKLVPHVQALSGDTSDNVSGCRGIGDKLAKQYIKRFGSVEATVANRDKLPPAKCKALGEFDWKLFLDLVTLRTDLSIKLDAASLAYRGLNMDEIDELLR